MEVFGHRLLIFWVSQRSVWIPLQEKSLANIWEWGTRPLSNNQSLLKIVTKIELPRNAPRCVAWDMDLMKVSEISMYGSLAESTSIPYPEARMNRPVILGRSATARWTIYTKQTVHSQSNDWVVMFGGSEKIFEAFTNSNNSLRATVRDIDVFVE